MGFGTIEILIIVVVLGLAGGAGWLIYDRNHGKKADNTPANATTSTAKVDPHADWKTYTDSKSTFSFKYPKTLHLEERVTGYIVLLKDVDKPQDVLMSVDARLAKSFDQEVAARKETATDLKTEELTNGVKISGKVGSGSGQGLPFTDFLFKYQNGALVVEQSENHTDADIQLFSDIVGTFKTSE